MPHIESAKTFSASSGNLNGDKERFREQVVLVRFINDADEPMTFGIRIHDRTIDLACFESHWIAAALYAEEKVGIGRFTQTPASRGLRE